MTRRWNRFFLLAVLVVALAAAGCQAVEKGEPLFMWQVSSETATVSLVGSIHVGQEDFFPLAAPIEEAFAAAPILAVEVDMTDPDIIQKSALLMMQKGMLPAGTTLEDRLSPELWTRIQDYAAARDMNLAMYQTMKPGIVAMVMVMLEYQQQGFDPELGIDQHFLEAAAEQGKEIRSLETIEDQLDLFLNIDDELDDILMAEFLDQMDEVGPTIAKMVDLWKAGDVEGLDDFLQEQVGDDPQMVAFYRRLLDDRNVGMADQIDAMLQGNSNVFVVVGAGHFSGPKGILSLLKGKGYHVKQVRR